MQMPEPTADHQRLARLAGTWKGTETMHPSPWDPKGGEADAVTVSRVALGGFAVVVDYEQSHGGRRTFEGHGVYSVDAGSKEVVLHWWDAMGQGVEEFRGGWAGDRLRLTSSNAMGRFRMTTTLTAPGEMTARMESSTDGEQWTALFDGRYARAD